MKPIIKNAAGIDVHKKVIVCTVILTAEDGTERKETREFRTFRSDLRKFARWLKELQVDCAVMESTSIYWKSVFETLEDDGVPAFVVNARHVKAVPGRKTDIKDSEWLADLAKYGLLRASFIPPRDLRELRMLTRYRRKLTSMLAAEKNRLQKILEDGGIRLSCVVSDIDGVSAREMIDALIDQAHIGPNELAKMVRGKLKMKKDELLLSLDGRLSDRHRFLLRRLREHIQNLQGQIREVDAQVIAAMEPYLKEWQLVQTIPGINEIGAAMLLAEMGVDMSTFGSADRLSSWAGMSSGNNQSAGKKKVAKPAKPTST